MIRAKLPVFLALRESGDDRLLLQPTIADVLWCGGRCRIVIDTIESAGVEPCGSFFQLVRAARDAEVAAFIEWATNPNPSLPSWMKIHPTPDHQQEPTDDE